MVAYGKPRKPGPNSAFKGWYFANGRVPVNRAKPTLGADPDAALAVFGKRGGETVGGASVRTGIARYLPVIDVYDTKTIGSDPESAGAIFEDRSSRNALCGGRKVRGRKLAIAQFIYVAAGGGDPNGSLRVAVNRADVVVVWLGLGSNGGNGGWAPTHQPVAGPEP